MFKHDGEDAIVGLVMFFVIIAIIVYVIAILASIIAGMAAVGGTFFGGGSAVKNYCSSFKENVIDSNRSVSLVA